MTLASERERESIVFHCYNETSIKAGGFNVSSLLPENRHTLFCIRCLQTMFYCFGSGEMFLQSRKFSFSLKIVFTNSLTEVASFEIVEICLQITAIPIFLNFILSPKFKSFYLIHDESS